MPEPSESMRWLRSHQCASRMHRQDGAKRKSRGNNKRKRSRPDLGDLTPDLRALKGVAKEVRDCPKPEDADFPRDSEHVTQVGHLSPIIRSAGGQCFV